jgi:hypothetical protein
VERLDAATVVVNGDVVTIVGRVQSDLARSRAFRVFRPDQVEQDCQSSVVAGNGHLDVSSRSATGVT